ncbi:MAG TPA: methyltransferase domain-containing protein [Armatimonadota bacterium]|nr:methyltransferase domain-containing protein [Armatimonadota bacterium]
MRKIPKRPRDADFHPVPEPDLQTETDRLLILHLRPARRKALPCAAAEALSLLGDLRAAQARGGPLSERGGVFWMTVPEGRLDEAIERLPRLGFTMAVDQLAPWSGARGKGSPDPVRWRGTDYALRRCYEEDSATAREAAPDRRLFALEESGGEIRLIRGYRGDSGPLSRRGLAVCDARLLVNLSGARAGLTLLDPFAGIGGIVLEAVASGCRALSVDIDPRLRPGLERLGAVHLVADARSIPYPSGTVDAIATEPPFDETAADAVMAALSEMARLLKVSGNLAMLAAEAQAGLLRDTARSLTLEPWLDTPLNRKGMNCRVFAWRRQPSRAGP